MARVILTATEHQAVILLTIVKHCFLRQREAIKAKYFLQTLSSTEQIITAHYDNVKCLQWICITPGYVK